MFGFAALSLHSPHHPEPDSEPEPVDLGLHLHFIKDEGQPWSTKALTTFFDDDDCETDEEYGSSEDEEFIAAPMPGFTQSPEFVAAVASVEPVQIHEEPASDDDDDEESLGGTSEEVEDDDEEEGVPHTARRWFDGGNRWIGTGNVPLFQLWTACEEGDVDLISQIIDEHSCDLNARDSLGDTALHMCALEGNVDSCTALLKGGADINAINQAGATPLAYALEVEWAGNVCELLRQHGGKEWGVIGGEVQLS